MLAPQGPPGGCGYAADVDLMDNSSSYPQAPQLLGQRFALPTYQQPLLPKDSLIKGMENSNRRCDPPYTRLK